MDSLRSMLYMARRFKLETAMNFVGLTVAFAACYLMLTQIDYHRGYNHSIPDGERVFRLESSFGVLGNRIVNAMIAQMPQVEAVSEFWYVTYGDEFSSGKNAVMHLCMPTNLTPFGAIGARCLDGKLMWNSYGERSIIIPASLARQLYDGRTDVAGQPIVWNGDRMKVQGVYEDFPDNCSMKNYVYFDDSQFLDDWKECSFILYVKLRPEVDVEEFRQNFAQLFKRFAWEQERKRALASGQVNPEQIPDVRKQLEKYFTDNGFRLRPIHETWFSGVNIEDLGNRSALFVIELACLLIVMIAAVNFLNFTLAESPMRIRSINTRRVLGKGLWSLRFGLLSETVLTALAALALSLVLCAAVSQGYMGLVEEENGIGLLMGSVELGAHLGLVALMVCISVVVGIAAGAYPAWFATSFEPALALKGSFGLTPKGRRLRSALVALQLGIALLMVIFIGILQAQSRYVYRSDYGFAKDEVVCAQLWGEKMWQKKAEIRKLLLKMDGVTSVSYSRFMLGTQDFYLGWTRYDKEHNANTSFTCLYVDCNYLRTMGIQVVEGRDFNELDSNCFIINKVLRQQFPSLEMGQQISDEAMPVVGVCENFRFASVRKDRMQEPLAFVTLSEDYKGWGDQLGMLNVRISKEADKYQVRQQIQEFLSELSEGDEVTASFLDEQIEQLYQDERRFVRQMFWLSAISLTITLIGVCCLTMFETEYRRKEMGIRKVMGASTREILMLFSRRYLWLLAISFVIAAPLAWYLGHQWLQSFAEHTPVYWWLFPLALLVVSIVTLATVILQSWRVANENPVNSIKNE